MKLEILQYLAKTYTILLKLPIRIYSEGKIVRNAIYDDLHLFDFGYLEKQLDMSKKLDVVNTTQMIMFGSIHIAETPWQLIVGPCASVALSDLEIEKIIREAKQIPQKHDESVAYLKNIHRLPIEQFYVHCINLNAIINHEIVHLSSYNINYDEYLDLAYDSYQKTTDQMYVEQGEYDYSTFIQYENKLLEYIRYGMVDEVKDHLTSWKARPSSLTSNSIREYKDRCISMVTLVSRETIKGGLNPDVSYKLFDIYCSRIENASSFDLLNKISVSMFYEFAHRIKDINTLDSNNPLITKAIQYINNNIQEKISLITIADALNVNSTYLSYRFKNLTGKSISKYINEQKINEAKRLLQFTDKSLIDISLYLGFSSQCYFQNVFKKYMNTTPLAYRLLLTNKPDLKNE